MIRYFFCSFIILAGISCGGGGKTEAVLQDTTPLTREQIESLSTDIKWAEDSYDFGDIISPAVISHQFIFVNVGQSPLVILQVSASCGCVVSNWPKEPIAIGDTSSIRVAFDSEGREGVQLKKIYIAANTDPSQHTLTMQGTVVSKENQP